VLYGWTDHQVKGIIDGSVTKLRSINESTGPVLYSEKSMEQLIDNVSERCNATD